MSEYTIEPAKAPNTGVSVYRWGVYEPTSVLAGQTKKTFVASFHSEEYARLAYPTAQEGVYHRSAGNTFAHLPGENDPVPGGMYPDDYDDGR